MSEEDRPTFPRLRLRVSKSKLGAAVKEHLGLSVVLETPSDVEAAVMTFIREVPPKMPLDVSLDNPGEGRSAAVRLYGIEMEIEYFVVGVRIVGEGDHPDAAKHLFAIAKKLEIVGRGW
jgi:hypothetical protein